jgi:hypothetical protein
MTRIKGGLVIGAVDIAYRFRWCFCCFYFAYFWTIGKSRFWISLPKLILMSAVLTPLLENSPFGLLAPPGNLFSSCKSHWGIG